MQLLPDEQGLTMWADADAENNAEARALVSAIERRDIDGMSFIFTIGDEEWQDLETDHPTRIITRIDQIFEVSAVIFPAYDQTTINARNAETLENAKAALERARAEKPLVRGIDLELAKAKYDYLYRR
jgi:HK97 family phage prohead protease